LIKVNELFHNDNFPFILLWKVNVEAPKMGLLYPNSFYELSQFPCWLAKLFGYLHFTLKRNDKGQLQMLPISSDLIWFVVSFMVGTAIAIRSSAIDTGNSTTSIIMRIGMTLLIKLTFASPSLFRILNLLTRQRYAFIVTEIQWIDNNLKRYGININHKKHFFVALSVTLLYYLTLFLTLWCDSELSSRYLKFTEMDLIGALCAAYSVFSYLR